MSKDNKVQTQYKSAKELRITLSEEIDALRNRTTTPKYADAIINAAGKIFYGMKIELEYAKHMGIRPIIEFLEVSEQVKKQD